MDEYKSLSHSKWECKYHVVFIPKCRTRIQLTSATGGSNLNYYRAKGKNLRLGDAADPFLPEDRLETAFDDDADVLAMTVTPAHLVLCEPTTDSRLVPLPPALCKYLGGAYPDYLALLAKTLSNTNAPNLAYEIARLAKRQTSEKMPFLFFLMSRMAH